MNNNNYTIMFCGLPATLKTYLSVRLSGRIGFAYIPSKALGDITGKTDNNTLLQTRMNRYYDVAKLVKSATNLGANLVIDGGFPTSKSKDIVLRNAIPDRTIMIHCICDVETRIKRLERRVNDNLDYEQKNSFDILQDFRLGNEIIKEDNPQIKLKQGKINSLLTINTSDISLNWQGAPPTNLKNDIEKIITDLLNEYNRTKNGSIEKEITKHFNDFAENYDVTTEWRKDDKILKSMQTTLTSKPSRVLDIGTGTGLASMWYKEQGHIVAGIDISPKMLQKASDRLSLVLLGNGTKSPFINDYFDLVLIRQCLHYVNALQLLKEAKRILKIGGKIVISGAICTNDEVKQFWKEFKNVTQPLRLTVFTSKDIKGMLKNLGFKIIDEQNYELTRKEKIDSIAKRSRDISGGLLSFLENIEKLCSELYPDLNFKFQNQQLQYRQNWVTIWAKKEEI